MLITGVQVGNNIYPLTEGQPLGIRVGETIRVFFSFKYKMPERENVGIWASLYQYTAGVLNRQGKAQTKGTITLDKSIEWKDYSGYIDITIGNISAGTYGLIVELPGRENAEAKIDDCIEVAGAPDILSQILPLVIMVVLMGMVTSMMGEGEEV